MPLGIRIPEPRRVSPPSPLPGGCERGGGPGSFTVSRGARAPAVAVSHLQPARLGLEAVGRESWCAGSGGRGRAGTSGSAPAAPHRAHRGLVLQARPGESTSIAAASSPLGTHLTVWTDGLQDEDGRRLLGRLSKP
jgi:hypothetical protein